MIFLAASSDLSIPPSAMLWSLASMAFFLLLVLAKCIRTLLRPTASRICLSSLGVMLVAMLIGIAGAAAAIGMPAFKEPASIIGRVLLLLLSLCAFILAIVGLATYDKKRHQQGLAQAIGSLVLGMGFTLFAFVSLSVDLVDREAEKTSIANVERPSLGYKTSLKTQDWKKWDDANQPLADFNAQRNYEAVQIIPVDLGEPPPDLETLATAFMRRFNAAYLSEKEGWITKPWKTPWGEGLEISGSRLVDGSDFNYIFRVASTGNLALLHAGWAEKQNGDLALALAALDAITLHPPASPAPPLRAAQHEAFSTMCNDIGIALYNKEEHKEAAHWFTRALKSTPTDGTFLTNGADAFRHANMIKEGLAFVAAHIGSFPRNFDAHVHHAYLLSETGSAEEGSKAFLRAIDTGMKDEDVTLAWLQHLNGKEEYALAHQAAEAWMKKHRNVNSRRWHAQTLAYSGEEKRALELLEALGNEFPDDRRISYDFGEALNDAGENVRAAEIATKLLADGKDAPRALMMQGWSQMGRKWYREAKESFEKAAAKEPDNEVVQNALRRASAMLGQGNNSDIKTPIEPVALPESLLKVWKEHPMAEKHGAGQPYVWLLTAKGHHFTPGKPARRTWHRRARIQTSEGASSLSSIEYQFSPIHERIFINRVLVQDEKGNTLASAPGDAYVMDLNDGNASHRKKLHFQIPALRPGCTVEYEVSIEDRSSADTFTFERNHFGDSAADIIFLTGAVDEVEAVVTHAAPLQTVREKNLAAWMGFNLPYDPSEPMKGLYEDRVPGLYLGGKEGTWEKIGTDFLKDIETHFKPDPEVEKLAATLTKDLKTPQEKVAALARHVQKEISYTAIEFGVRARRPNPAGQTLKQQYGDCKDQALLLHQLLHAADIECHLALVNSDWRTQTGLPTLDQFNHMVVHVPALGKDWLIDPTDKDLPSHLWQANNFWQSHALVLQPGKPWLSPPMPTAMPGSSLVTSKRTITPEGNAWHVDETFVLHGYYAAWMRSAFSGLDEADQLRKIQRMLEKNAPVRVHSFTFKDLKEISQPAALVISYDVPDRLHEEDGLMRASLPALWETEYLVSTFIKGRTTPFLFRYPFTFRSEVTVAKVPNLSPSSIKALTAGNDGEFTKWKIQSATSADTATLHFEFEAVPGEYPATSYVKWHDQWHAALKSWDRPLIWKP